MRRAIFAGRGATVGAPVTLAIIWINVVAFVLEVLAQGSMQALAEVSDHVARLFGANGPAMTLAAHHYESLVTACFVHGSLLHVALNMYALRQVGPLVERAGGSARYAVMYLVSGVTGSVASVAWNAAHEMWSRFSVGASGAICGVMGAAIVVALRVQGWRSTVAWDVGIWLGVILLYGTQGNIDNAAHVGGFVGGVLVSLAWRRGAVETRAKRAVWIGASAAIVAACMGVTAWRALVDPYATMAAVDWSRQVTEALARHDCARARRAMKAVEELPPSEAELAGLRQAIDDRCAR